MAKLNAESVTSGSRRVTLQGEAASNVLENHGFSAYPIPWNPGL